MPLNIDPFNPPSPPAPPPLPVQVVAQRVIADYFAAAKAKTANYLKVQASIWGGGDERGLAILAAIERLRPGLTQDMQVSAILEKSTINFAAPGTIVDSVPEATITLPG